MSSWQSYAASTAGGAAGGVAFLYSGPVGAGVIYGATASATRQTLNVATGKQRDVSLTSFAVETGVSAVGGKVVPMVGNATGALVEGGESLLNQATSRSMTRGSAVAVNDFVEGGVNKALPASAPMIPRVGDPMTRKFGGGSDLFRESWTTDPVPVQSRNSLGLPALNTAEFQAHATVLDNTGMSAIEAREIAESGVAGGGGEILVPKSATQLRINAVTMPDSPLPSTLPTDPRPAPAGRGVLQGEVQ